MPVAPARGIRGWRLPLFAEEAADGAGGSFAATGCVGGGGVAETGAGGSGAVVVTGTGVGGGSAA